MNRQISNFDTDAAAAGFAACYERLPHNLRREFWQLTDLSAKLTMLAGFGGGANTLATLAGTAPYTLTRCHMSENTPGSGGY